MSSQEMQTGGLNFLELVVAFERGKEKQPVLYMSMQTHAIEFKFVQLYILPWALEELTNTVSFQQKFFLCSDGM